MICRTLVYSTINIITVQFHRNRQYSNIFRHWASHGENIISEENAGNRQEQL